jgi:hypothetical protein
MKLKNNLLNPTSQKNKIYITPLFFALISVLLILFIIWPTYSDIKIGSNQIIVQKGQEIFIEDQNNDLQNFKKNYKSYQPNLEKIDNLFVDSKDPVEFIKFLETTLNGSVDNSSISLSQQTTTTSASKTKTKTKPASFISFKISCAGSFKSILNLIEKLENGPYLIEAQNLSIKQIVENNSSGSSKPSGLVEAEILIKVYTE